MLPPEDYGFKRCTDDNGYEPVITDIPPAPPELLRDVRCACKSSKALCSQCSCRKYGIACTAYCKCNGDCLNTMTENGDDNLE